VGVIVLTEQNYGLPVSNMLLKAICEAATILTNDAAFSSRLADAAEYGFIDLWECTTEQKQIFANGIGTVRGAASIRIDIVPSLLVKLENIAAEVRSSIVEGER